MLVTTPSSFASLEMLGEEDVSDWMAVVRERQSAMVQDDFGCGR
jgi:hypothetical protein